ncbi:MAG: NAD(P)H-hydrate dehydratase [Planctomycetes bacterium]|nr:NAD(P)H-hydrate dehydratase [Planctomycetota bacterium]
MERDAFLPAIPPRPRDAHKGDFGRVLILAGSRGMTGAACLATEAALRSGVGLATLAVPDVILPVVSAHLLCSTFLPLPATLEGCLAAAAFEPFLAEAGRVQAVAIGPGLSRHPDTSELVRRLVPRISSPLVLDADALNAFAGRAEGLCGRNTPLLLTPHPGEMSRVTGRATREIQDDRENCAVNFAREHSCLLVLKGHHTLVTDGQKLFVNSTGNPGMATGGSGDVLTGILAGLLAQGFAAYDAAKIGVFVHGLAGDLAAADLGEISLTAEDILAKLPASFLHYQKAYPRGGSPRDRGS